MEKNKIYIYGDGGVSDNVRLVNPITHIKADDKLDPEITIGVIREKTKIPIDKDGIYIFSRPVSSLEYAITILYDKCGTDVRVIADLDDSFWDIPKHHVAYESLGEKSGNLRALERNLKRVDAVTVSTNYLKDLIISKGIKDDVTVIPNICNTTNKYTAFRRPADKLRFGFSGTITHREDFKLILKPLVEFVLGNDVMVGIGADAVIYKELRTIPEKKKFFVPGYPYDLYPLHLSHFDVLLIPLVDDKFNSAKSDIKILDAVANKIPFIASDVLPYRPYGEGEPDSWAGLVVGNKQDEWYSAMSYMLSEKNRLAFVNAGDKIRKTHGVKKSSTLWRKVILDVASKSR